MMIRHVSCVWYCCSNMTLLVCFFRSQQPQVQRIFHCKSGWIRQMLQGQVCCSVRSQFSWSGVSGAARVSFAIYSQLNSLGYRYIAVSEIKNQIEERAAFGCWLPRGEHCVHVTMPAHMHMTSCSVTPSLTIRLSLQCMYQQGFQCTYGT